MSQSEQVREAAWWLQIAVHGLLSGRVIAEIPTTIEPRGSELGDFDFALDAINQTKSVLDADGYGWLTGALRQVLDESNDGVHSSAGVGVAARLMGILAELETLSGRHLDLPLPADLHSPGGWVRLASRTIYTDGRLDLHHDLVVRPDATTGAYIWIHTGSQVRVAAITDGGLLVIEQQHYLVPGRRMWQLPGGNVDPGERALTGARRELREETGYTGGTWTQVGELWPLPGLTPATVILFVVDHPITGPAAVETGLIVHRVAMDAAVAAVFDGMVGCASSAALILLAARHLGH